MSELPNLCADDQPDDGLVALRLWMDSAADSKDVHDARLACLATTDAYGAPDARMVIVREVTDEGLVFCTSLVSSKAKQIDRSHSAALVFWWEPLMRQVRVRGQAKKLADGESDGHFSRLSRRSQIAAQASDQSSVLDDHRALAVAFRTAEGRYGQQVPRPASWGCYRLGPEVIELWQGHPADGMHDRFRYERSAERWTLNRIAP